MVNKSHKLPGGVPEVVCGRGGMLHHLPRCLRRRWVRGHRRGVGAVVGDVTVSRDLTVFLIHLNFNQQLKNFKNKFETIQITGLGRTFAQSYLRPGQSRTPFPLLLLPRSGAPPLLLLLLDLPENEVAAPTAAAQTQYLSPFIV